VGVEQHICKFGKFTLFRTFTIILIIFALVLWLSYILLYISLVLVIRELPSIIKKQIKWKVTGFFFLVFIIMAANFGVYSLFRFKIESKHGDIN
jgi:hypothetical protein